MCVVGTRGWQPVIDINADGLVLAVGADGEWVVGEASARSAAEAPARVWLLPLLERPYRQITATPLPFGVSAPPWNEVLRVALSWQTVAGYWQGMALRWLEDGCSSAGLVDELSKLKDEP
jgi:hypothetical protein